MARLKEINVKLGGKGMRVSDTPLCNYLRANWADQNLTASQFEQLFFTRFLWLWLTKPFVRPLAELANELDIILRDGHSGPTDIADRPSRLPFVHVRQYWPERVGDKETDQKDASGGPHQDPANLACVLAC
jgi:hypothetical protein